MEKQKTNSMDNSKGFTLLELMVLVAIIGILVGLATSSLNNPRMRLRAAARDIVSNVQNARFKALETGESWAVQFDTSSETPSYRILSNKGADKIWNTGTGDDKGDDTVYKTVYLEEYPGISFGSGQGAAPKDYGTESINDGMTAFENRFIFTATGMTDYKSDDVDTDEIKYTGQTSQGVVYIKTGKGETFAVGMISLSGMIKTWRNYDSGWEE